jgi:ribosomal protein S18 acetylase RimI-like enzyme
MLVVTPEAFSSADSQSLIEELCAALRAITGDSGAASFSADDVDGARGRFVVARNARGEALGCGALRPLEGSIAEIKRMYARPGNPGTGSAILTFLEREAMALGYDTLWLETRSINARAVRFYEARHYRRIPNYGKYAGNPLAVCFAKTLTPDPA